MFDTYMDLMHRDFVVELEGMLEVLSQAEKSAVILVVVVVVVLG